MLNMLVEEGYLDKAALDDEAANENEIIDALYRGLKGLPLQSSWLLHRRRGR